jgi:Uma2 family endonuclease
MASHVPRRVTVDTFLAFEGEADTRYQLVRGVITAMAPAQLQHGRMVARLARLVGNQLKPPCEPITEAGVKPAQRDDSYWQADLVVTCQPLDRGQVYLTDPVLIVEVLSPSTEGIDRSFKLRDYIEIPSVQDIVLVSTKAVAIEHWQRAGDRWQILVPSDILEIPDLGVRIAIDDLYADMLLDEGAAGGAS